MNFWDRYSFWREDGLGIIQSFMLARSELSLLYYEFYWFNKSRSADHETN
jgi:hypothetical protein